ncbi:HAL/PAL/TAL family ammonia-lyase [Sporolactobacillus laevolacticus]|uniref:Phenylalanine ammonia-lyase n=1 Tax=Sporolactobacillus laevolacticus DSM 442 TaxID=1395513 RepID=V6IXX0_9BACL|nr:aromatic amino acid ammonia-lyase [Sporolactobacillus laevolacticus]EST11556.1 phenylalanine ammonia-lyase [Sporolactobacillus laevolacticus DSM 442]
MMSQDAQYYVQSNDIGKKRKEPTKETKIVLNGNDLSIEQVIAVARKMTKVEIADEALQRIQAARKFVNDQADANFPTYGFNRGVGLNKDRVVHANHYEKFNHNLILSHSIAIGTEASEEQVRATMLIRLNSLLQGYTGIQVHIVFLYKEFLNRGIRPVMLERGSVGAADLGQLSSIGMTMIGEGMAYYKRHRMPAKDALEQAGLQPATLGPKDGLAIVSSNAFALGKAALLVHELDQLVDSADLIYALSLEGLDGNVSPLFEKVVDAKKLSGQKRSAAFVRDCLRNSYLWDGHARKHLQDPLSFRGAFSVHGSVRDALDYVRENLTICMNASEDNPSILLDEKKIVSSANYEITTLVSGIEMLSIVLAHLSKIACYRIIKLSSPDFTGLTRFLVPRDSSIIGFATIQKTFAALDAEIRHLCQPVSMDFFPLEGDIEDHATNSVYALEKARLIIDNLYYILGIEAIHAAQAIDLREHIHLGIGTREVYETIRRSIGFLDKDRDLSLDIEKAFRIVKSKEILRNAEKAIRQKE